MSSSRETTLMRAEQPPWPRSRMLARRADEHPRLIIFAIVVAATAFYSYWVLRDAEWAVMPDELLYVKLALHLGDTLSPVPAVREHYYGQFTLLYPALTTPLFHFFETPFAFRAAHALNALLMASTAIPVYPLSRTIP